MVRRQSGAALVGPERHDPGRPLLQHHHRLLSRLLQSRRQTTGQSLKHMVSALSSDPSDPRVASPPVRDRPLRLPDIGRVRRQTGPQDKHLVGVGRAL